MENLKWHVKKLTKKARKNTEWVYGKLFGVRVCVYLYNERKMEWGGERVKKKYDEMYLCKFLIAHLLEEVADANHY